MPPQAPSPAPGYPYPLQPPPSGYPYQQGGMYPPPGPLAYQQPRSGSGKRIAWMVGGVLAIAAVVGVLWMTGVIFAQSPRESVEQLHQAFEKSDLATFDKYLDSEAVLGDFLDQAALERPPNDEAKQVRAHLPEVADAMKRALLDLPAPVQSPDVQKLTDGPSRGLREARKRMAYKGIASESRKGSEAIVNTTWGDATGKSTEIATMEFRLKSSGNHWKVIAIHPVKPAR